MGDEKSGVLAGNSAGAELVDLFGAPVSQIRDRWGRPSFKKDKENQQLVALLVSDGWTQERIAERIGCDAKTLRKNFSRELKAGGDMIRSELLAVLYVKAKSGNVGAVQKLLERIDIAIPVGGRGRHRDEDEQEPKPEVLGKKAQLALDAQTPPPGWGETLQ